MPFYSDRAYDFGIRVFNVEATNVEICSAEPTTYTQATSTFNLGTKAFGVGNVSGAPAARSPNGRQVTTVAVTDGTTSVSGSWTHWAITDRTNSRLLAAGPMSAPVGVTAGIPWTLPAMIIGQPAPT